MNKQDFDIVLEEIFHMFERLEERKVIVPPKGKKLDKRVELTSQSNNCTKIRIIWDNNGADNADLPFDQYRNLTSDI